VLFVTDGLFQLKDVVSRGSKACFDVMAVPTAHHQDVAGSFFPWFLCFFPALFLFQIESRCARRQAEHC
jgi:hypothetical protein